MKNNYYENYDVDMPKKAVVVSKNNNTLQVNSDFLLNQVKVLSLNGVVTMPDSLDEVILLPIKNGEYIAIGNILTKELDADCEMMLYSKSGGKIKFFKNGSISINGFTITVDGDIV